MPVNLDEPLRWEEADEAFLEDLQGNILKGHGRENTINLFLQFNPAQAADARRFVNDLGNNYVTSAGRQLAEARRFKEEHIPGGVFVAFLLTFAGYEALGIAPGQMPDDNLFQSGLKSRVGVLEDPPVADWDAHFQEDIHALLIIAENSRELLHQTRDAILAMLPATAVSIVGDEIGLAMRNTNRDGIEHFGYVDGRSQPLLLVEDIEREADTTDGTNVWDPAFPLKQVLVPCRGGATDVSFGSFFVFRKLEQNVKGFKDREKEIADELGLLEKDRELAGAMIVGRFEDGTPVVLQSRDGVESPVPNNFNYESDKKGLKCPFHAHIRKTNPRGESVGVFAPDEEEERGHIMARRGITYGTRVWENNMPNTKLDEEHLPTDGVGLLFMAYQRDLANQFEFTQRFWANNEGFVKPAAGLDPIIGLGTPTMTLTQTRKWGVDDMGTFDFRSFVTMKGGEYFYAPCISFLKSL